MMKMRGTSTSGHTIRVTGRGRRTVRVRIKYFDMTRQEWGWAEVRAEISTSIRDMKVDVRTEPQPWPLTLATLST